MSDLEPDRHAAVEVRTSEIAGRGLFSTADLPARTVVLRLASAVSDVPSPAGLGSRFPNHSCDPNLGWIDAYSLATMADVPAGAELLTDYAMSTVEPDWFLRCHCPSYRCRQMVEGTDWRIPQLQRRYDGWWAPHVQRLVDTSRAG